jgi:hypothetical protein
MSQMTAVQVNSPGGAFETVNRQVAGAAASDCPHQDRGLRRLS